MAFSRSGLCRIGGSGVGGSTWQYSSADAKATVVAADYMLLANDELNIGDVVLVVATTVPATPTAFITYVKAQSATSITLAGGLVITP
jgi:hypothetical protein